MKNENEIIEETIKDTNTWVVKSLNLNFNPGYDYASDPKNRIDHYDGSIRFTNEDKHEFTFQLDNEFAQSILDIIGDKVADASLMLAEKMTKLTKK